MSTENKVYIGDGVYVAVERFAAYDSLVLTTENGIRVTNTIVLEPEVWSELVDYVERQKRLRDAAKETP